MEHTPLPLRALCKWDKTDKLFMRLTWKRMYTYKRKVGFIIGIAIWPFLLIKRSINTISKHGKEIKKVSGIALQKQLLNLIILGLWHGRPPDIFYMYGLYEQDKRLKVSKYITHQEFRSITEAISNTETIKQLDDKAEFEKICNSNQLPCAKTLAIFENGVMTVNSHNFQSSLPKIDLFIKPNEGIGGEGCLAFSFDGNQYHGHDGSCLSEELLIKKLILISKSSKLIIQEKLQNHTTIKSYNIIALATVRVLTYIDKNNNSIVLKSIFKIPMPGKITDNLSTGGISCPVNFNTGSLSIGFNPDSSLPVDQPPGVNTKLNEIKLPMWDNVINLAIEAHQSFSKVPFIGWDIAITDNGCILIEGNNFPDVEGPQQCFGPLLSDQVFIDILNEIQCTY